MWLKRNWRPCTARDSLYPCSAIDKYSISHRDSFLQQIVVKGWGGENESARERERETEEHGNCVASLRLDAVSAPRDPTSRPLHNIHPLPSISLSHPHQPIFTHTHARTYARTHRYICPPPHPPATTIRSKAYKFFLTPPFHHFTALGKTMLECICSFSLVIYMSVSQIHIQPRVSTLFYLTVSLQSLLKAYTPSGQQIRQPVVFTYDIRIVYVQDPFGSWKSVDRAYKIIYIWAYRSSGRKMTQLKITIFQEKQFNYYIFFNSSIQNWRIRNCKYLRR
jgi:hypothetical protein